MHVFVTGATGFVGSKVVPDLLGAGHEVSALARSDASAAAVEAMGAGVVRGSLEDTDVLHAAAAAADGVIHLGFNHDFSRFAENGQVDAAAIAAMGAALAGTDKPLVTTSGTGLIADGVLVTEKSVRADNPHAPRQSEPATLALVAQGVRAMAVRLPQVHGPADHGFTALLIGIAREQGKAAYVGEGGNRWPAVHRDAAARLYRLALERGQAGRTYHAVAEQGIAARDLATEIGRGLGLPVARLMPGEAAAYFGWFAMFATMDNPASSDLTQAELGWDPSGPTLIEDLRNEDYFG